MEGLFYALGLIVIIAAVFSVVMHKIRQPVILAYVVAGMIIGPSVLGLMNVSIGTLVFSELGIALLLFVIGMELDVSKLKKAGVKAAAVAVIRIFALVSITTLVMTQMGFSVLQGIYVGLIVSISSTVVIAKTMSDKKEFNTPHGELILAILLVEDIVAVLALSFFTNVEMFSLQNIQVTVMNGIRLISFSYLISKFVISKFLEEARHSTEMMFVGSLATMFAFSVLANLLGFSFAIGAFIAGIVLGKTQYQMAARGCAKPLKDFFIMFFFVNLGMGFQTAGITFYPSLILIIFALVFIAKPLLSFLSARIMGVNMKTSVMTALSFCQASEFSLLLASQGVLIGYISAEFFSMITFIVIASMMASVYVIRHNSEICSLIFYMFPSAANQGMPPMNDLLKIKKRIEKEGIISDQLSSVYRKVLGVGF